MKSSIEKASKLLGSKINQPRESAADFYYTGIKALFRNDDITAQRAFKMALELGYEDLTKVKRYLENFENRI